MLNLNFQNGTTPALNARNMNAIVESINTLGYAVGGPNVASTVSEMTDTEKVYVYTGSETGYTAGNWYYYNGSAWVSGGVYQATAVETDTTLTMPGVAADAKVTGDKVTELKSAINTVEDFCETLGMPERLAETSDFISGLWTGNGYRTDGNYGKYKSLYTDKLIPLQDCTVEVYSSSLTNYVCSIGIFDNNKDFLSAPSSMGNKDISSGTKTINKADILALYGGAKYISVEIGKYASSTYYDLNSDTTINVYSVPSETVLERLDGIDDSIEEINEKIGLPALTTSDFFYGMWTSSGLRTDNAYGLLKTHQDMLVGGNYKIVVTDGTAGVSDYVVSITTYDSNGDFIEIRPTNTPMNNGVYYYKGTATAKKIRINIGIYRNGAFVQVPATADIKILYGKDYANESVITVDQHGGGDFELIADAIRFANDSVSMPVTIFIKPGVYNEVCNVKSRYLSFIGENRDAVIWINHTGMYTNAPLFIDGNFTVENITFEMLDDEAPESWTPGMSQTDPATMLPGYAFHIDGGSAYTPQNGIYTYRLGVVRNCRFYSVAFPAVGTGLHSHQKLVFENCDFIRETSAKYDTNYTGYQGAFLNHNTTHSDDSDDQHLEMINCRSYCNLGKSATFNYSIYGSVDLIFIDNSFWCDATDDSSINFTIGTSVIHGISNGNNNTILNA